MKVTARQAWEIIKVAWQPIAIGLTLGVCIVACSVVFIHEIMHPTPYPYRARITTIDGSKTWTVDKWDNDRTVIRFEDKNGEQIVLSNYKIWYIKK